MTAPAEVRSSSDGTALFTDQYEFTMLRAAIADGTAYRDATFEAFTRRLPEGRGYGVVAGIERILDAVTDFRFTAEQVDFLLDRDIIDTATADYLTNFRFTGTIEAYREGELFFPYSPILTVRAPFGQAVLLETVILSILNYDCSIASAAARMVTAAAGRTLLEMGSRRVNEHAAVAASRAAYIAGFDATSNLRAGQRYGIPTFGTSAHAFTLAHASETAAFESQIAALGAGTTLLVDTYDIAEGIRTAVKVAGPDLGGIRIDSGDLADEARKARVLLDSLGNVATKVVVTGDLDEHSIAALADAPVNTYGVGTSLVTGSGSPAAGIVYKLVSIADTAEPDAVQHPVAKRSSGKVSVGGRKRAYRELDDMGHASREHVVTRFLPCDRTTDILPGRALQVTVMTDGAITHRPTLAEIRAHHRGAKAEMLPMDLELNVNAPALNGQQKG